jgi:phage terminase Nu1 subunit (DNA packaging protein)
VPLVDVKHVAKALNLTPRRVQQLVPEGLPKELRGKYDLGKCMLWYIRYLQAALEKKSSPMASGEYAGLKDERIRGLRADAELKEIQLAEKRGTLVSLADARIAIADMVHMTKARMLSIAPRLAPDVMGETSRVMVQAKIEKSIKESLNHLADDGSHFASKRDR